MLGMTAVMWFFSTQFRSDPVPLHFDSDNPSAAPVWDPLALMELDRFADCLDDLVILEPEFAARQHQDTGQLSVEALYHSMCRSMLLGRGFVSVSVAYGERTRAAVLALCAREEGLIAEALADPFLVPLDRAVYWQVGLERVSADVRELSRRLDAVYAGLIPVDLPWPVERFFPEAADAIQDSVQEPRDAQFPSR